MIPKVELFSKLFPLILKEKSQRTLVVWCSFYLNREFKSFENCKSTYNVSH